MATKEMFQKFFQENPEAWEKGIEEVVLFRNFAGVTIENPSSERKQEITLTEAAGDMNGIYPQTLLQGSLVTDSAGCVISRNTAEELFGTYDAVNSVIKYDGRLYYVRGILDVEEPLMAIQGGEKNRYDHVLIFFSKIPASRAVQIMQPCLGGDYKIKAEGDLYAGLGNIFMLLPVWVIVFKVLGRGKRKAKKQADRAWKKYAVSILFPVITFACICILLLCTLHFTGDYVPTAWSDFAFWGELFREKSGDMRTLMSGKMTYRDAWMVKNFWICAGSGGLCTVLAGIHERTL